MESINIDTIVFTIAVIVFSAAMLARWRQNRREEFRWSQPLHTKVKWAQIHHSSNAFKRSGGFQVAKKRPGRPLVNFADDVWNKKSCDRLQQALEAHGFYIHGSIKAGGNGYMAVVVRRKTPYSSLKSIEQTTAKEAQSYILTFPPSSVLNLEAAVLSQLKYWGIDPRPLKLHTDNSNSVH